MLESRTEPRLALNQVKGCTMVEINMSENTVETSRHRLEMLGAATIAIGPRCRGSGSEKSCGAINGVSDVMNGHTVLGFSMCCTEVLPIIGCRHLWACLRRALTRQGH